MTAKEMFEALDYKQVTNNDNFIEYMDDSHGDGDYKYVSFNRLWKEYEVGYYDGYETKRREPMRVSIKEHEAITKKLKELGWLEKENEKRTIDEDIDIDTMIDPDRLLADLEKLIKELEK